MKPTRVAAVAAATLALAPAIGVGGAPQALADTSTAAGCIAAKQVWLQVTTDDGRTLASQCVGTPKTGTAALQAAKLPLTRDDKGLLCTIGNYPTSCPAKFTGQFWNYYHQVPGKAFEFATQGADQSVPQPGSVEAWCYNAKGTQTCTPPAVKGLAATTPSPSATPSASHSQLDEVTPPPSTGAPSATPATPIPTATTSDAQPSMPTSTTSASTTTVSAAPAPASATSTTTATDASPAASAAPASDSSSSGSGPWGVIATIAVIALAALGYLLYRRQRRA